jgi:CheY-like chemotaxis protein
MEPTDAAAPAPPAANVLVVEDSRAQRALLCAMLTNDGHVVAEARDGIEGETMARARRYDLVVTDYEMPGMNGMELTRRLRKLPEYEAVPILIMSARADLDSRVDGLSTGAHDYLVKPVAQREVEARVRSLLQLGRAQRALEQRNAELADALDEVRRCQRRLVAGEKLAYAGRLAGGIAHECNSPLQALSMSLGSIQLNCDDMMAAIPPDARAGDVAIACDEMPALLTSCTAMLDRLAQTVGRFRALEHASLAAAAEHTADLRLTVERAVALADAAAPVTAELGAEPAYVRMPHTELEGHLATVIRHIAAAHGPVTLAMTATTAAARVAIRARLRDGAHELLGADFDDSGGRVTFDMSVSSARESLIRMGATVEVTTGADRTAVLELGVPLAAAEPS